MSEYPPTDKFFFFMGILLLSHKITDGVNMKGEMIQLEKLNNKYREINRDSLIRVEINSIRWK